MKTIRLDGRKFTSEKMLHKILKEQLDFPDYYGENADALWDCLIGWVSLPLTIEWECFEESKNLLGSYAELILTIFQRAQKEKVGRFFIIVK